MCRKLVNYMEKYLENRHKKDYGIPNKINKNNNDMIMIMTVDPYFITGATILFGNDTLTGPKDVRRTVTYDGVNRSKFDTEFNVMLFNYNHYDYLLSYTSSMVSDNSCLTKLPEGYKFDINRSDKEISNEALDIMFASEERRCVKSRGKYNIVINGVDYGKLYYNELRKGFDTGNIEYDKYTEFEFVSKDTNKGVLVAKNNGSWEPGTGIMIGGEKFDFSNILRSTKKDAKFYQIDFVGAPKDGLIYDYTIIVKCQGPTGIFNSMNIWFTDETNDRYKLMVYSSIKQNHYLNFNSSRPNIKKIEYEFNI